MSDNNQSLTSPDLWIRLIYMLIFWLLSFVARVVIGIVAFIQFFVVLFSGETNKNLKHLGEGIARWTQQNYLFLCFASDQKPYPFQDWPGPASDQNPAAENAAASTPAASKPQKTDPEEGADVPVVTDGAAEGDDKPAVPDQDTRDKP